MAIRIKQLPTRVANQIAAGEVIERPASVVKELLENAYDATADQILIEIGYGGLNQIKISDNGSGIDGDDLPLAVAAHATSKIDGLDDLFSIASMGFRGEALASIASISKISISSKPQEQKHAMMLRSEGEEWSISACARNQGTTIDVRDLFYNVPVRKTFLKTERLEFLAIEAVVRRFAMSAPHVALTLKHNGKDVLVLPSARGEASLYKRMVKLYGQSFAKNAVYLDVERSGMRLHGWLSGTAYQRSQNDRQWVYINQRMVKDKLINHALKQVYEGLLHPGRFPCCLLYFNLPVSEVDVNVHPTKHEVRFQQPRLVHDFFTSQLSKALASNEDTQAPEPDRFEPGVNASVSTGVHETTLKPLLQSAMPVATATDSTWITLNTRFAIVFIETKAYLIDSSRLQHYYLRQRLEEQTFPLSSRPLLLPLKYSLPPALIHKIVADMPLFNSFGIDMALSDSDQLIIQRLPVVLPQLDIKHLLQSLSETYPETADQLMSCLVLSQSIDLYHLSREEKNQYMCYIQSMSREQLADLKIGKYLSEQECQVIFND